MVVYQALVKKGNFMHSFFCGTHCHLSSNDKAAAINLAFLLDIYCYEKEILNFVSNCFTEEEKLAIYAFWLGLTTDTQRAYLCMAEFEGRI